MKKIHCAVILLATLFIQACNIGNGENYQIKQIKNDVPKFLKALPGLSHDSLQTAFQQINKVMNYNMRQADFPENMESDTKIEPGKKLSDGQIALLGTSLIPFSPPNEFALSLMIYPPIDSATLFNIVSPCMDNYTRADIDNKPSWKVNGWILQISGHYCLCYYPITTRSIMDTINEQENSVYNSLFQK